jgi:transcriptional regulator with XRE-family HTH domain
VAAGVPETQKGKVSGAELGTRLRQLRKKNGLTQAQLACQIGIRQPDLSRMEKGEYRVSLDNLIKILGVFDVQISEFFSDAPARPDPVVRQIASEDMQLLHMLRRLSPEGRREVMEYVEFKVRREATERRATEGRRFTRNGT